MILVGCLFAFDVLVAFVLTFVYFTARAKASEDRVAERSNAVASDDYVVQAALGTELSRQRSAIEKLSQQYLDLRQTVNDAALGQGLGRGNG